MDLTRRRLRILQVIAAMHIGGAEHVVAHLVRGLSREHDVALCCTKTLGTVAEQLRADSLEVIDVGRHDRRLRYLAPWFLRRTIARFAPDVIHTHSTAAVLHTGPLALMGLRPRWVHTFHFGNYDALNSREIKLEGFLCRRAAQLVAVADRQRESIIRRHRIDARQIVTIQNGVETNPFVSNEDVIAGKRAQLGFLPSDIVVGTIAVLSKQKGITYFLSAARRLLDRDPRLRFLVVGGGHLEPLLRAEADALDLGARVVFTGWRQDAAELMAMLDVFVMSSLWEAMPMALLEAMAARRAIVVTDVGDNCRVVGGNGQGAIVVPPADAEALAHAIYAVTSSPALASGLRETAYREYLQRFSVERMVSEYARLYEQLTPTISDNVA
jgi:glycosyltransferase involved in cell wall biosynthesis